MIKDRFLSLFNGSSKEAYSAYILSIIIFSTAKLTPSIRAYIILFTLLYIPVFSAKLSNIDYFRYGLLYIRENLKKTFYYLFIWVLAIFPAYFILIFIFKFGIDGFSDKLLAIKLPKDILYYLSYNIIVVGFTEEFFYRGYLQPLIQKKHNYQLIPKLKLDTGVVITSLLFGIGHFLTYFTVFSALTFLPSIVFGILRNQTNNILASMIFHGISNAVLYVIIFNIGGII